MTMCRQLTWMISALVLLVSCGREKGARACFDEAMALYECNQFAAAKSLIDTINVRYPKEVAVRKEALTLMRMVERGESIQNIAFCDSLLPIREKELLALQKGFVFEKDSAYDEIGNYVWNAMTVEKNVERSYIRCGVNEEGEMYVSSVFFGSKPIEHTGLKLTSKDGLFAETPSIPYDGGLNYRFKDNGNTTEVVTYKGEHCKSVANFVHVNDKERIKAEYTGGKPYAFYLSDGDKTAIKATYELALVLSEIKAMKKEKEKCEKRIKRLDGKLGI